MREKSKIIFALQQISNISSLLEGNEYERFISSHLFSIQFELERQLTNLNDRAIIGE
jgi:hypothetical protein